MNRRRAIAIALADSSLMRFASPVLPPVAVATAHVAAPVAASVVVTAGFVTVAAEDAGIAVAGASKTVTAASVVVAAGIVTKAAGRQLPPVAVGPDLPKLRSGYGIVDRPSTRGPREQQQHGGHA